MVPFRYQNRKDVTPPFLRDSRKFLTFQTAKLRKEEENIHRKNHYKADPHARKVSDHRDCKYVNMSMLNVSTSCALSVGQWEIQPVKDMVIPVHCRIDPPAAAAADDTLVSGCARAIDYPLKHDHHFDSTTSMSTTCSYL